MSQFSVESKDLRTFATVTPTRGLGQVSVIPGDLLLAVSKYILIV